MIEILKLQKSYGKNLILKDISLTLERGQIISILGPNGSGKTTLIKSILGLVIPQVGDIRFEGETILGGWEYRKKIAYLPQIARFPENLKIRELVNLIKDIRQQNADDDYLIQFFGLEKEMAKSLRSLSGGTRQKVNMLIAFMFDSPVIILDEPTVGLDPVAITRLKELLAREKDKGKLILFTTHIMSLVEEISDEIIFLLEGEVYFKGSVSELNQLNGSGNLEKAITNLMEERNV